MAPTSRFADRLRTAAATSTVPRTQPRRRLRKTREAPAAAASLDVQEGELFAARLRAALSDRPRRTRVTTRG